jgi:hypothetical protein
MTQECLSSGEVRFSRSAPGLNSVIRGESGATFGQLLRTSGAAEAVFSDTNEHLLDTAYCFYINNCFRN